MTRRWQIDRHTAGAVLIFPVFLLAAGGCGPDDSGPEEPEAELELPELIEESHATSEQLLASVVELDMQWADASVAEIDGSEPLQRHFLVSGKIHALDAQIQDLTEADAVSARMAALLAQSQELKEALQALQGAIEDGTGDVAYDGATVAQMLDVLDVLHGQLRVIHDNIEDESAVQDETASFRISEGILPMPGEPAFVGHVVELAPGLSTLEVDCGPSASSTPVLSLRPVLGELERISVESEPGRVVMEMSSSEGAWTEYKLHDPDVVTGDVTCTLRIQRYSRAKLHSLTAEEADALLSDLNDLRELGDQAISDLQAVAVQPSSPGVGAIAHALAEDLAAHRAMEAVLDDFVTARHVDLQTLEVLEMQEFGRAFEMKLFDTQAALRQENAEFKLLSEILKARHDAAKSAIENVR